MGPDELQLAIEKSRRTVEQLIVDRDALRAFDPRVAGIPTPFDRAETETLYAAAIDAAQRTLDTFIVAAERAANHPQQPRADDGQPDRND